VFQFDRQGHQGRHRGKSGRHGVGPDLPDARHVLLITMDNDLYLGLPTQFYPFAIDPTAVAFMPQETAGPLYAPGQVKKALC
jgi:hypothetical protein